MAPPSYLSFQERIFVLIQSADESLEVFLSGSTLVYLYSPSEFVSLYTKCLKSYAGKTRDILKLIESPQAVKIQEDANSNTKNQDLVSISAIQLGLGSMI